MKKASKYYHEGDGIIREVKEFVAKNFKDKNNESKSIQRKKKKQNR